MRTTVLCLCVILASVLAPGATSAQSTGELSGEQGRHRSRFGLELGFYHGGNDLGIFGSEKHTVFVPSVFANVDVLEITPEVSLSFDFQLRTVGSIWKVGSNERTDFRAGNALFGARVAIAPMRGLRIRGGFGVVAPFLNVYESDDFGLVSVPFSSLPIGGWDPWLVARGYVPLVFRVDGEYRQDFWFVGGEAALGLGVPVLDGFEGLGLGAQLGVFGGVRPIPELAAGLRLQTAMYDPGRSGGRLGNDPSAVGFFSMVPFVRGELNAAFAELRFFVSLADNPSYDSIGEKAWGLYLLVGSDFDVR